MIKETGKASWNLNNLQILYKDKFVKWCNEDNKLFFIKKCPFCSHNEFSVLSNVDRFGLNFSAIQCNNCKLIITNPQIKEKYLPEYYNKFYHKLIFGTDKAKDYLFDLSQGRKIFKKIIKFLDTGNNKTIKVFEVGAGSGNNLKSFNDLAKQVGLECEPSGLEFSMEYVKKAKKNKITLYPEDLNSFVKKNNFKFDVIILSHVLEHVVDFNSFLKNIRDLMHGKSILYIEVPGVLKLHENFAYKTSFKRYLVHAHIYHFTAETLANILIANGFKIISINEKVEAVCTLNGDKKMNTITSSDINTYLQSLKYLKYLYLAKFYMRKVKNILLRIVK